MISRYRQKMANASFIYIYFIKWSSHKVLPIYSEAKVTKKFHKTFKPLHEDFDFRSEFNHHLKKVSF